MMRKIFWLFALLHAFALRPTTAAADTCPCGDWLGSIAGGSGQLSIVFHITEQSGKMHVLLDVPEQKAKGLGSSSVEFADNTLNIAFAFASYRGVLVDDSTIRGTWIQNKRETPLQMRRVGKSNLPGIAAPERPQTPKPPYPYSSEEVTFTDPGGTITYGATITFPSDKKKHPAILLISGSGQQNRDEEFEGHKPFFVIADYLTRLGFVVMRVDDRGIGMTTGSLDAVTTKDFAGDANVELDYLKRRPEVDPKKIGMIGHSEGGLIAPILAGQRDDISFIVSLAGPGTDIRTLMIGQNAMLRKQLGIGDAYIDAYMKLYAAMVDSAIRYKNDKDIAVAVAGAVSTWRSATPEPVVLQTTGIRDDVTLKKFSAQFAAMLSNPWMHYFLGMDPQPAIRALKCKVLALNGEKDVQVISKENLEGWRSSLAESKSKSYKVKELPGLNHMFQECVSCTPAEYEKLDQTFSPAALKLIGDWLLQEIR